MNITITSAIAGCAGRKLFNFTCDDKPYSVVVQPEGPSFLFEFAGPGDDCVRTQNVDNDEILQAVLKELEVA